MPYDYATRAYAESLDQPERSKLIKDLCEQRAYCQATGQTWKLESLYSTLREVEADWAFREYGILPHQSTAHRQSSERIALWAAKRDLGLDP